jgi:predicted dehydrogenase
VTFESPIAPYSPGNDPWDIIAASPQMEARIAGALAGHRAMPSRYEGQFAAYHAALTTGAALPVTLADARASLELATALYHSAAANAVVTLPIAPDHPSYSSWTNPKDSVR